MQKEEHVTDKVCEIGKVENFMFMSKLICFLTTNLP